MPPQALAHSFRLPCVVVPTLGGTDRDPCSILTVIMTVVPMPSHAEYYRRRGMVAQQRAAQTIDLSLKETFKDVARHWLMLAEREDWIDRQRKHQPADKNP
jgi:hypothetical protein